MILNLKTTLINFTLVTVELLTSIFLGLPSTRLGTFLENRVNDFLRRQNHPESGEVTVRVVHASDKTVEVKPGMKARCVVVFPFSSRVHNRSHTTTVDDSHLNER